VTKHDVLTQEEFAAFTPNANITKDLDEFAKLSGKPNNELKVLDWGCGRGRHVLWLRQKGYKAFGVDVDSLPIENGVPLFKSYGYTDECLRLLNSDGQSSFEDGSFDYILSGNVLEHVSDLDKVCAEMSRLTRKGGGGYHVFPAHRQPKEGHLFMPFVHWIPPGRVRKFLIHIFVLLGQEPKWVEVRDAPASVATEFYYQYSINNIFYRPYATVRKTFEKYGFEVNFKTLEHPKLRSNPLISSLTKVSLFRNLLNHLLLSFKLVEMRVKKL